MALMENDALSRTVERLQKTFATNEARKVSFSEREHGEVVKLGDFRYAFFDRAMGVLYPKCRDTHKSRCAALAKRPTTVLPTY